MDILKNFMKETAKASDASADSATGLRSAETSSSKGPSIHSSSSSEASSGGNLLLAGCVEWDSMTSKSPSGLANLNKLSFPSPVTKCFSSSSSPFAFVLLQDESLYAIGCNDHGQLGLGDTITRKRPTMLRTAFPSHVLKVATGRFHSLVLLANGDVYAAGSNVSGQCGLGANSKARDFTEFTKVDELRSIVDVACGWEHSLACNQEGRVFTFGHPNFGQLGNGTTGEFIKESQRVNFDFVSTPFMVPKFVSKDRHGSLRAEYPASSVHIAQVAAGRNHSVCIEAPSSATEGGASSPAGSRVFTWGFGGYGRLGHNSVENELRPRELEYFSKTERQPRLDSKSAALAICGSSFTVVLTKSKHIYFFGKMSNSPRGEASIYPKLQQELCDWKASCVAAGPNLIVTSSVPLDGEPETVAWGQPVAGKIGFEGDASSTSAPKYIEKLTGARCIDVSCGYGHVAYVVANQPSGEFPDFPHAVDSGGASGSRAAASASADSAQKKRKALADTSVNTAKRKNVSK